jgi:hypothetical protein
MVWNTGRGRGDVILGQYEVGEVYKPVVVCDLARQSREGVQAGLDLEAIHQRANRGDIDTAAAVLNSHLFNQDTIRFEWHDTA